MKHKLIKLQELIEEIWKGLKEDGFQNETNLRPELVRSDRKGNPLESSNRFFNQNNQNK